jgi:hypothetical protein
MRECMRLATLRGADLKRLIRNLIEAFASMCLHTSESASPERNGGAKCQ